MQGQYEKFGCNLLLKLGTCFVLGLLYFAKASFLPLINDAQFNSLMNSDAAFGVIPVVFTDDTKVSKIDDFEPDATSNTAVIYLSRALPTLQKFNVQLYTLNCQISEAKICKSPTEEAQTLHLYKKNSHVYNLAVDELASHLEAEGQILLWLKPSSLQLVDSIKNWKNMMKFQDGDKNIVLAYSPNLGSAFHNTLIKSALQYENRLQFAYITDAKLVRKLGLIKDVDNDGKIWLSMCAEGLVEEKCITTYYTQPLTIANLNRLFKAMLEPSVVKLNVSISPAEFHKMIDDTVAMKMDSLIFTAGSEKQEKAFMIARKSCAFVLGHCRCFYVDGDTKSSKWAKLVPRHRIHLSIIPHESNVEPIEIAFLLAELPEEIHQYWMRLEPLRKKRREVAGVQYTDWLVDDQRDEASVFEVQDDPVAHSVHSSKRLRDFYLYDHKSFSRLTDVTYDDVINGDEYAVILFTLEFNPKSLAVLSHFWLLQKEMKDAGKTSPLHRVECFDWPDVCAKADVITYPRMFFYRGAGSERNKTEYSDIWSLSAMRKSIVLNSLSRPVESIEVIPATLDQVIYGLVATETGDAAFRGMAKKYGDRHAFQLLRDSDEIKSISSKIDWEWPGRDALMARSGSEYMKFHKLFENTDDITSFISQAFLNNSMAEVTVSNYQQYLSSPLALFIQFKDVETITKFDQDGEETANIEQLTRILNQLRLGGSYAEKANFVWMDSSFNTPGEYLLHKYSIGLSPSVSLVHVGKSKAVSLKSFEESPTESEVITWIDLCISGNAPVSFHFLDDRQTSRLEGYDYLRYMKEEGTFPINNSKEETFNLSKEPKKSVQKKSDATVIESTASSKHTEL